MADETPALPPPSEPFPGSRTPGWNDPPTLQYTTGVTSGRTRLNLNKRVAFPLQSGDSNPTTKPTAIVPPNQSSVASMPPPPMSLLQTAPIMHPIAVVHPMPSATAVTQPPHVPALPSDAQMECALRTLRGQVDRIPESTNVRREEVERRLGIIEQLWRTGNLSTAVQEKIYRLAQALTNNSFSEAMEIFTSLVVNHSSECASWSIALRHIVLTLQPSNTAEGVPAEARSRSEYSTSSVVQHI